MHGRVLLEEVRMVHAFRITFHRERTSSEVRQQRRRDVHVIVNHLALGRAGSGIEDLIQIRELQLAAFNFNDGWGWHRKIGCWLLVVSRSGFSPLRLRSMLTRRPRTTTDYRPTTPC